MKRNKYMLRIFPFLLICFFIGAFLKLLPFTKDANNIKISNMRISEAYPLEIPDDGSYAEKIECFINESSEFGMNFLAFNKIYSKAPQYAMYTFSFEIYNRTTKTISISGVSSKGKKGVYVSRDISNVEKVFIAPNDSDTVSIAIYIDHSVFDDNDILDEIIESIKINIIQSDTDSNWGWFLKEKIISHFFVHSVTLETNQSE